MTSSDSPSPKLADNEISNRHSLHELDFTRARKGGDDLSTDDEQSFMDDKSAGTKKSAADVLENSLHSLSIQNGGKAKVGPTLSPLEQHKKKVGLDFLKVLEQKNHKRGSGGASVVSQLSLLVNDSASGAPFDEVYDMGDVLGEGGFAFVYRCTHKKNGHDYAVKEIITTDNQVSAAESVRGEINALKLLREGPYVVRLLDVFYEPDRTMVVQEIMKGGDLLDKLTEIEVYEPDDARKVSRTLLEALDYCHKKRICHRDIKPENILLVKDDDLTHIKIADFGCAKRITGPKCLKTLCGSPQYVAPELLTHEDGYNELCDMWSCGVVIYVLLGGYAPFDAPECELAELITAGNYEFHEEYWDEIPASAKDLIMHLLQVDPDDRFNPSEALDCRWLRRKDKDLASSMHESTSSFGAWLERRNSARSLLD